EWEICELGQLLRSRGLPPVGVKLLRILKKAPIAVRGPLAGHDLCSLGYGVATNLAIVNRRTAKCPHRRIQPHRLADDSGCVLQTGKIFKTRRSAGQNAF